MRLILPVLALSTQAARIKRPSPTILPLDTTCWTAHDGGMRETQDSEGARQLRAVSMSHKQVADLIGVDQSVVSRWRNGKRKPSGDSLFLLSDAFGIEPQAWYPRAA